MKEPVSASTIKLIDNTSYVPLLVEEYVLLGMLEDYLGRNAGLNDDLVDQFYPAERGAVRFFLDHVALLEPSISAPPYIQTLGTGHIRIISAELKARLEAFYEGPVSNTPWEGRTSMRLSSAAFPVITSRQFVRSEMDPRFSYIYGVYLRYGKGEHHIELANSSDRVELLKNFLVDLDSEWVSHKFTVKSVPCRNSIDFEPSQPLAALLARATQEKSSVLKGID